MATYMGKLLRVNLSEKRAVEEEIPKEYYSKFISGRGLGALYLYKELKPQIDPLGPENKLIFLNGILAATGLQGFSKWCVMSKSPLTGTIFRAISGGNFGVWMKYAGYDLIILEGKAESPTYLFIDKDGVHFFDADILWGLDPRSTQKKLKEIHGKNTESAVIGIAGERGVRYAVITSGERTASRGGMGTVMGSKNLKAVAINVSPKKIHAYDEKRFKSLVKNQIRLLKDHPRRKLMNSVGTPYITKTLNSLGILPVKNFQEGSISGIEKISGEQFLALKKQKAGCFQCMTRCGGMRVVKKGPFKNSTIDGPEYESIYSLGPLLGVLDSQFIVDANALCDFYGIDTISTGVCISFLIEAIEKGMIKASDIGDFKIEWGDKEGIFSLIDKIGKREGIGKVLGEGVKRASEQLGKNLEDFAMHVKGLELPGYDPRGVKGYALSFATSNIGGSHMYGRPREELSGKIDPYSEKDKGGYIAEVQKVQAVEDSLIVCTFSNTGLNLNSYAEFLFSATGIESLSDPAQLLKVGERILCIERSFNIREGFNRKDDILPNRFYKEPLRNAGPASGQKINNFEELLNEYYTALGYDLQGVPTQQKLIELDLTNFINNNKEGVV